MQQFDTDWRDDPDSYGRLVEEISGYVPRTRDDLPADTKAVIRVLDNAGPHGGPFVYRSILTDAGLLAVCDHLASTAG